MEELEQRSLFMLSILLSPLSSVNTGGGYSSDPMKGCLFDILMSLLLCFQELLMGKLRPDEKENQQAGLA